MASACVSYMLDGVWFDGPKTEEAEYNYQVYLAKQSSGTSVNTSGAFKGKAPVSGVAEQIAQARERINQTLQSTDINLSGDTSVKLQRLDNENNELRKLVDNLVHRMSSLEARLSVLESGTTTAKLPEKLVQPAVNQKTEEQENEDEDDDDDDDDDLFGSESEEDEEEKRIREERLAAYKEKKSKKPTVIAKSSILLDVKPWDDTTDMVKLEESVRAINTDGLVWGASKLVEVAYGIQKLQISCVVEDDKVGTDFLEDKILEFEDLVQSMDVVAFNKI